MRFVLYLITVITNFSLKYLYCNNINTFKIVYIVFYIYEYFIIRVVSPPSTLYFLDIIWVKIIFYWTPLPPKKISPRTNETVD